MKDYQDRVYIGLRIETTYGKGNIIGLEPLPLILFDNGTKTNIHLHDNDLDIIDNDFLEKYGL